MLRPSATAQSSHGCFQARTCNRESFTPWEPTVEASDPLGESFALDQFHHQKRTTSEVLQSENRRNVRMVQRREDTCFLLEARNAVRIGRQYLGQHFYGNLP